MKCNHCGYESNEDFVFCPKCNNVADTEPQAEPIETAVNEPQAEDAPKTDFSNTYSGYESYSRENKVAKYVTRMLSDKLFLFICIAMSINCGCSLLNDALPLLNILITIFLWLAFAQMKKDTVDEQQIRCISGTVFASEVILYITGGFIVLGGVLVGAVSGFLRSPEIKEQIMGNIGAELTAAENAVFEMIFSISPILISVVFLVIGIALILVNVFCIRSIHKYLQSLYQSISTGRANVVKVNAAYAWLTGLAVLFLFPAITQLKNIDILMVMSNVSCAAACAFSSVLIKKYSDFSETDTEHTYENN